MYLMQFRRDLEIKQKSSDLFYKPDPTFTLSSINFKKRQDVSTSQIYVQKIGENYHALTRWSPKFT